MFWFKKKENFPHIPKEMRQIMNAAFPMGEKQINEESAGVLNAFPNLFTLETAAGLVVWVKCLILTNKQLSFDAVVEAINRHEGNRLTVNQSIEVYKKILSQHLINKHKRQS